MPKTKLDKYSVSAAEKDERIIRIAMARNGLFTAKSLADKLGSEPSYVSRSLKKGLSNNMKLRIISILQMNEQERAALMGW